MCLITIFTADRVNNAIEHAVKHANRGGARVSMATWSEETGAVVTRTAATGAFLGTLARIFFAGGAGGGLIHLQAPTDPENGAQPSIIEDGAGGRTFLWHNGMLLSSSIRKLREEDGATEHLSDTQLLHRRFVRIGAFDMTGLSGSAALVFSGETEDEPLRFFFNELVPMYSFADGRVVTSAHDAAISETDPTWKPLRPGVVHRISRARGVYETNDTLKVDEQFLY